MRKGVTLTELLIGITIMSILAGVMTLNGNTIGQQTARREADRVAAFFRAHLNRANMTHDVVWFTVTVDETPNHIEARTGIYFASPLKTDKLEAREKCSFTPKLYLIYNTSKEMVANTNRYYMITANASVDIGPATADMHCITVTGADGKTCTVRISKQP